MQHNYINKVLTKANGKGCIKRVIIQIRKENGANLKITNQLNINIQHQLQSYLFIINQFTFFILYYKNCLTIIRQQEGTETIKKQTNNKLKLNNISIIAIIVYLNCMATTNQVSSLCHSLIEKLSTQAQCILDNDAETESLNLFTFTRIIYEDQNVQSENLNRIFKIHSKLNKMKYQENYFAWYRNRNIPSIQIKKDEDQKSQVKFNRKTTNSKKDTYTFYINACYIEKSKFAITCLKGENCLQDQNQCSFQSLKFVKTSYILNGSCVRLFIIILDSNKTIIESYISSKIHISSWKNYLKDKPSKSSIFSPFMPAVLNRTNIIQQKSKISQVATLNNKEAGQIPIYDNIQGLSDYFKGSTIKQKICHPLFIAIKFAKTIKLYFQSDLQPTIKEEEDRLKYQVELFVNIHKYFIESISSKQNIKKKIALKIKHSQNKGMDEKVKGFLQSIYSEMVQFIDNDTNILDDFILYNPDNLINMQLAYKLAYPQLEMMLINQQSTNLIQKQLRYYNQDIISEKDLTSDNLYQIPKLEITLNRDFVKSDQRIFVICSQICESQLEKQLINNQKITKSIKNSQNKDLFDLNIQNKSNSPSKSQESHLSHNINIQQVENIQQQMDEPVCQSQQKYKFLQKEEINPSYEINKKIEFDEKCQDQIIEDKLNKKLCKQDFVKQENNLNEQDKAQNFNFVKKEENNQNQFLEFKQKNHKISKNNFHNHQYGNESELPPKFSEIYVKQIDEQYDQKFFESSELKKSHKKSIDSSYLIKKDQIKVEKYQESQNLQNLKYEAQQNIQFKTFESDDQNDNYYSYPEYKEQDQMIHQASESPQQNSINPQYSYPNSSNTFPYYQPIQYQSNMHMVMPNPQYQYVQYLPPQPIGLQPMYFQSIQPNFQHPPINNIKYQRQ
ncbi:hypothetical protein TTHERM_00138470 (macronuclear) [Tetrahymena thermophila SB210]|uniref:Uncharacterized protein n=1 Tax=Tetrahymena thermophila (strain SB210) TaxID=312017 RepID=I7MFB4_TETTS|nr:hypothetical protein TTHERM_00138470 [Tetrahymena thermophila SB210]EAR99584.3 hypothetical protein TTHERM_00138470 [Tetrahymena thermophila SB210]|eukprot:XP_001019829.3 hypothetical protein TTHERM_00138470 [Tetrahymena thermophila SB210]